MTKKHSHTHDPFVIFDYDHLNAEYTDYTPQELNDLQAIYVQFNYQMEHMFDIDIYEYTIVIESELAYTFSQKLIDKMIEDILAAGWDEVEIEKLEELTTTETKVKLGLTIVVRQIP